MLRQISPESEPIYDLILSLYQDSNGDWKSLAKKTGVSDENLRFFLEYAAQFLGNNGNYKSFGDSKFVPRIPCDAFESLASTSERSKALFSKANSVGGGIYETPTIELMHLGYADAGHMTTYYPDSPTITKEEITLVNDFLEKKGLPPENTRLRKTESGSFELLIASAQHSPAAGNRDLGDVETWELGGKLQGKTLKFVCGDYSPQMAQISESVKQARLNAANDIQTKMLEAYEKSYTTGSIEAYKQSQRYWIQDMNPQVESDLGFVETYRDPHGVRAEWEGMVAMVGTRHLASCPCSRRRSTKNGRERSTSLSTRPNR